MKEQILNCKEAAVLCNALCGNHGADHQAFQEINKDDAFDATVNVARQNGMYKNQEMCVRWGNIMSKGFKVSNGVRQGGILSPYLFNIYLDDLSVRLQKQYAGCKIVDKIINHLLYADDLVLMCPSFHGLQDLLDICGEYADNHNIKFNTKKSVIFI